MSRRTKQTKQNNGAESKSVTLLGENSNSKVTHEKNTVAKVIESCLNDLYAHGIVGMKALHNLAYLTILKFIEPHIGKEIDIDNFDFPNHHDISHETFQTKRKHLLNLVRFSNLAKEPEQNLLLYTEALWEDILSEHPVTSKIFQKGNWFDIDKPDPNSSTNPLGHIKLLKTLIDKINTIPHTEVDVLGHAYEHVANNKGGQMLGQFFTQTLIKDLMIDIINPQILPDGSIESCCDPTMGSAGFLSTYVKYLTNQANTKKIKIDWVKNKEKICGKEVERDTFHLAMANMLLSTGHIFEHLEYGNSLDVPITKKFDTVLANPPFGMNKLKYENIKCVNKEEHFPIPIDNGICLFLQTIIHMLKINGRAAVVLPRGKELFGDPFKNMRQFLMKTCEVKEIINLPQDAFTHTSIKTCVIYFIKKKESSEVLSKVNTTKTRSKRATYEYKFIDSFETKSVKFYEYDKEEKGNKRLIMELPLEDLIKKHLILEVSKYLKQEKENYGTGIDTKKLGDICDIKIGGTPSTDKPEYYTNGTHVWVSIGDMKCGYIYDSREKITDIGIANSSVKLFPKETVLFSFKLSIGKMAIAGVPLYTNEAIAGLFTLNEKFMMNKYLYHYMANHDFTENAAGILGKGALNKTSIAELEIPVPPIGWQKNIVDYLDFLENSNDTFTKEIEMRQNLVNRYIKTHTAMPQIKYKKLGEICEFKNGKGITSDKLKGENYPVIGGGQIPFGYHNEYNRNEKTILCSSSGAYAGFISRYLTKVWASDCFSIHAIDHSIINEDFLFYYLKSIQTNIYEFQAGSCQPHVYAKTIADLEIPNPTIEDQKIIVEYCEKQDKKIAELKQEIEQNKLMAKDHITRVLKACEKTEQDEPELEAPQQVETKTEPTEEVKINGSHPRTRSKKVADPAAPKKSRSKKAQPIQKIVIKSDPEDEDS